MPISVDKAIVEFVENDKQQGKVIIRQQLADEQTECVIDDDARGFLAMQLAVAFDTPEIGGLMDVDAATLREMRQRALFMLETRARLTRGVSFVMQAVTTITAYRFTESLLEQL